MLAYGSDKAVLIACILKELREILAVGTVRRCRNPEYMRIGKIPEYIQVGVRHDMVCLVNHNHIKSIRAEC